MDHFVILGNYVIILFPPQYMSAKRRQIELEQNDVYDGLTTTHFVNQSIKSVYLPSAVSFRLSKHTIQQIKLTRKYEKQ